MQKFRFITRKKYVGFFLVFENELIGFYVDFQINIFKNEKSQALPEEKNGLCFIKWSDS